MPRNYGHLKGCDNVEPVCRAAWDMGVEYVTMYAFSTENWKRPDDEVAELMRLLAKYLKKAMGMARDNNMRVRIIGDRSGLSPELNAIISELEEVSKPYDGLKLQIAINYGGRDEIRRAFSGILREASERGGSLEELAGSISEEEISSHLDLSFAPDPDLMIRTSGEQRLSNYLIWQLAYAEFYFTDTYWPDFGKKDLEDALRFYAGRTRRFGGV